MHKFSESADRLDSRLTGTATGPEFIQRGSDRARLPSVSSLSGMTRKLHVQLPGAFLRCPVNSAVRHLRTVQHNYSVVRVLCTVLVHCTVRTVQCTRTFLLHKSGEALSPDLSIGAFASHFFCTAVQYCIPVYRTDSYCTSQHFTLHRQMSQ